MDALRLSAIGLIIAAASVSASSEPTWTTFQWPAQLGPELAVSGAAWALILIPNEGATSLNATFTEGAEVTEHARHYYGQVHGPYAGSTGGVRSEDPSSTLGPFTASLARSATWSSLYVQHPAFASTLLGLPAKSLQRTTAPAWTTCPSSSTDATTASLGFQPTARPATTPSLHSEVTAI